MAGGEDILIWLETDYENRTEWPLEEDHIMDLHLDSDLKGKEMKNGVIWTKGNRLIWTKLDKPWCLYSLVAVLQR